MNLLISLLFFFILEKEEEKDSARDEADEEETRAKAGAVRDKLKKKSRFAPPEAPDTEKPQIEKPIEKEVVHGSDSDSDEYVNELERERREQKKKKA